MAFIKGGGVGVGSYRSVISKEDTSFSLSLGGANFIDLALKFRFFEIWSSVL